MANKLNKHTLNSEELFKRLESKDTGGLDDFEKEALEGFDSLENIDLAKQLNAELDEKINERFFEKKAKNNPWRYLSIAAGLVLIVGLSIFFINFLGNKKELASDDVPKPEKVMNEVSAPNDLKPAEEPKKEEKVSSKDDAVPAVNNATGSDDRSYNAQPARENNNDGLKTRMVTKELKKPESLTATDATVADAEGEKNLKQQAELDKTAGPPAGNVAAAPVAMEDQKAKKGKAEEESYEKSELAKAKDNYNAAPAAKGGVGKDSDKKSEAKERRKNADENLATEQTKTSSQTVAMTTPETVSTNKNLAAEPKRDESGAAHNSEFESRAFAKPQDYIKSEINKSEMLKENVKSFKAELSIDEKGAVKEVKFLTPFSNCKGCETEMRKILLNMPGWKGQPGKIVKETVSFIY